MSKTVSPDTLNALAAKIDSLQLTDDEDEVLGHIVARASGAATSDDDVEGHLYAQTTWNWELNDAPPTYLKSPRAQQLAAGIGITLGVTGSGTYEDPFVPDDDGN